MALLSYLLSVAGLVSSIVASLVRGKNMRLILFLIFLGNVLVGTSYLCDGKGINGAAALYLGAVQSIINYFFDSKNKRLPKWLIAIYVVAIIVLNIWVAKGVTALGVLVIVASLSFIMGIIQTSGSKYRFWTFVNMILWITYDILSQTYGALTSHVSLFVFTVAGMIIHDKKRNKEIAQ